MLKFEFVPKTQFLSFLFSFGGDNYAARPLINNLRQNMRHKEPYMASLKSRVFGNSEKYETVPRDSSYSDPTQNTEDSSNSNPAQNTEDSSYSNPAQNTEDSSYSNYSQSTDDLDEKPKLYLEKIKKQIDLNKLNNILSDNEVREI